MDCVVRGQVHVWLEASDDVIERIELDAARPLKTDEQTNRKAGRRPFKPICS